ncbi:MAG TPA: sigma-54-dependent Fis family transcriptional regulator [Desulfovibrio sp.]|nr:sigma-54-dependent Fis family transcriptional regulator [Desulfovibrio sp.]
METSERKQFTVLAVDDDRNILQVLEARLASAGYRLRLAGSAEEALELLAEEPVDCIVSDVKMPGMGGAGLLKEVLADWPEVKVILLTAYGSIPDAVASIRTGAADYLTKPFDGRQLVAKIDSLLAGRTPARKKAPPDKEHPVSGLLWGGKSPAMRDFLERLERVARGDVNVLVTGESGTGKELVARILHQLSPRAKGPLVIVDCGSTPATLLESELFGHVKGSFTHALKDKKGLIEEADGGTLLLDEIGNISPEMQTRLLRFLQEKTIRRIGDTKEIPVSCRVVAATNADLPALVRKGAFREDLYFRLKVVSLAVPPLRDRPEDIPVLAERFLEAACKAQNRPAMTLAAETLKRMAAYHWPGNVREMKNAIEAGVVFARDDVFRPGDLALESLDQGPLTAGGAPQVELSLDLEENEHQAILRALKKTGWVKKAAADLLGISRRAIHYKIKKYGIPDREE